VGGRPPLTHASAPALALDSVGRLYWSPFENRDLTRFARSYSECFRERAAWQAETPYNFPQRRARVAEIFSGR
jgi:hypothetical protein